MTQPEARIYRKIKAYLQEQGAFVFKVWGSERMMAGLPDLICCLNGRFVAIEVKTPEGSTSPRQDYVMQLIREAGGIVGVARSVRDAARLIEPLLVMTPGEG